MWLTYLPVGGQAPVTAGSVCKALPNTSRRLRFRAALEQGLPSLPTTCSLKGRWQPPRVSTGILTQSSALPVRVLSQLRAREPSSQSLHFPSCFVWVLLFRSALSLGLIMNQLKHALKLPPSTEFYGYLVEWPFNVLPRMGFFWGWKGILLPKRLGQQACTKGLLGNPAGLVTFTGKALKARSGMQADSHPCEPRKSSRAAANGSFFARCSVGSSCMSSSPGSALWGPPAGEGNLKIPFHEMGSRAQRWKTQPFLADEWHTCS